MRYQTALRPVRRRVRYTPQRRGARTLKVHLSVWNIVERTLAPGRIPSSRARPPFISSTALTGSAEGMEAVDCGTAFDEIVEIVPSDRMNNTSSGRIVSFIQNDK